MSTETLAVIISGASLLLAFGAAFGWMIKRMDGQFAMQRGEVGELRTELRGGMSELRTELRGEMSELRTELRGEMSELRTELRGEMSELRGEVRHQGERLTAIEHELIEIKIAVARLEGPRRTLIAAR